MTARLKRALPWLHGILAYLAWRAGRSLRAVSRRRAAAGSGRLCVIQVNSLGDVLMITPLLQALVSARGAGQVDVVVRDQTAPLLAGFPGLGRLIPVTSTLRWRSPRSVLGYLRLLRHLRAQHYWAVLDASRLLQSAWLSYLARPDRAIGAGFPRQLGPWSLPTLEYLYSDEVPIDGGEHMIRQQLALLGPLGIPAAPERMILVPAADEIEAAAAWLTAHGFGPGIPFAVVHPGAKWPPKRWPAERFRLLLSRLRTAGLGVVCIGTSQDGPLLRQVTEGVVPAPASLAGELPLGAVAALIQRARIYIGNDSGPMHIACAVGTPAVGLFGPTLPDRTGPLGNSGRGIVRPIDCRPCRMYFTRDGCERGHNYCMDLIQVDDVWAAVTSMCRAGRGRAPIPEPRA